MGTVWEKNGNIQHVSRRKGYCLRFDRWLALSAAMILMGCSGLTYTYAVYSEHIKQKLHYTQEQIDNIGAAKDFGAFLGLISGFLYNFYQPWVTVYIGALLHLLGYGLMWMTMVGRNATSIWMLCLYVALGTGGDGWVDTACMMTSLQNFGDHRGTAMGILKSQLGLSGAMFVTVKFHSGNRATNLFAILMLVVASIMYAIPVVRKPFSYRKYVSSSGKSQIEEIGLTSIPTSSVSHKIYLDRKADSTSKDCETERSPLTGIAGLIEEDSVQTSGIGDVKEHNEVQNMVDLTVWQCLIGIDFWLVNFIVISGGGSGLAIINNFAQVGKAARSKDIGLYVGIISVGSCFGRITSGYGSDFLMRSGYPRPLCLFITQMIMTISCILLATGDVSFLYIGSALIGMAYGAYWTLSPAVLSEVFGLKPFAMLYKIIGIAPTIGSYVFSAKVLGALYDKQATLYQNNSKESTVQGEENTCYGWECFGFAFLYLSLICLIGALACLWLIQRTRRLYSRKYQPLSSPTN